MKWREKSKAEEKSKQNQCIISFEMPVAAVGITRFRDYVIPARLAASAAKNSGFFAGSVFEHPVVVVAEDLFDIAEVHSELFLRLFG